MPKYDQLLHDEIVALARHHAEVIYSLCENMPNFKARLMSALSDLTLLHECLQIDMETAKEAEEAALAIDRAAGVRDEGQEPVLPALQILRLRGDAGLRERRTASLVVEGNTPAAITSMCGLDGKAIIPNG